MFIICPKCSAKYRIPEGISLDDGQKMKCSACGHVFTKGEEAPLLLDEPLRQVQPPPKSETPISEAFSTPLYTQPIHSAETIAVDSLPEAFQPVEGTEKKTHIWAILLYLIVIIGLCIAGWTYRDLLKPSFNNFLPTPAQKSARPARLKQVKIEDKVKNRVHPSKAVKVKEGTTPEATTEQRVPVPVPKPAETSPSMEQPQPLSKPMLIEEPKPITVEPIATVKDIPTSPTEMGKVTPNIPPSLNETTEDAQIPLFDGPKEMEKPTLAINKIAFQVKPDETGNQQLLVEGILQNNSATAQPVLPLTVQVFNKAGQLLTEKKIHVDVDHLSPGQSIPFYTGITPVPPEVDLVDVKL